MSVKNDLIGAKGGSSASFRNRPDNLRSTDTFEALIGLVSGRIRGLAPGGLQNLYVDDVPIEDGSGNTTLKDFNAVLFNGDPAILQPVTLQLGGSSGAQTVNLPVNNANQNGTPGDWRYGTVPQAGVDYIDLRFVVNSLFRQDKKGIYDATASLEIELQPSGSSQWINPLSSMSAPSYNQNGIKLSSGFSLYALADYWDTGNTWYDPAPGYLQITGKTTQPYVKELRVAVPNTGNYANKTWQVRVRLIERDSYTNDQDQESRSIGWESIAGVSMAPIGNREEWRGLAYLQINGKASDQLTGVPTITGVYDLSEVRVPPASVWDSENRIYTGATWDGATEEVKWTQCPAFQMKDLIEDGVSGISALTPGSTLNKWDTLEASKWFAQRVPDGQGGTHPRYSMNYILDSALSVNDLMQYVAGAVGSYAWDEGDGNWRLVVEKPENATALFTKESIVGEFNYSHTDLDGRFNDMIGVFRNEARGFEEDRVRVFDQPHIDNYGRRATSIALVGCTNRQEALRRIKIRQLASLKETRQVAFVTNRQGNMVQPFSVILVADGDLASDTSVRTTGRLVGRSSDTLTVRDTMRLEVGITYKVHVTIPNPDYNPNSTAQPGSPDWRKPTITVSRTITNSASERGDVKSLKIDAALPNNTPANAQIALEAVGLPTLPKQYRVLDVEPQDNELVSITAIEIYTNKWNESDNVNEDEILAQRPNKIILPPVTPADGQMFSVKTFEAEFQKKRVLTVRWDRPGSIWVDGFKVEYNLNAGPWITLAEKTQDSYVELQQPQNGAYTFRITTVDRRGGVSAPLVGAYDLADTAEDYAPTQKIGPLADRPVTGSREGDKYTTNDQNPNLTYIWSNGQWHEESNFVTGADQITYDDGKTVEEFKPAQPGADVTGDNTAKDTNAVGGRPATVIITDIDGVKQTVSNQTVQIDDILTNVDDLYDALGSSQSAEQYANAADQYAKDAAAARDQSQGARDAAQTARDAAGTSAGLADQAKVDAQAARNAAETARDAASGSSTLAGQAKIDAQSAKTAAESARDTANQKAAEAAQSVTNANGWATTAKGYSETATQKADAAGQSASIADAKASVANTKAGEASTSAQNAATSEANAEGYKNAAYTSSQVSASSRDTVLDLTGKLYPDFSTQNQFWSIDMGPDGPAGGWELGHTKGAGYSAQQRPFFYAHPKSRFAKVVGRTYRATFWFWQWSGDANKPLPRVYFTDENDDGSGTRYLGWTALPPNSIGYTNPNQAPAEARDGVWVQVGADLTITNENLNWLRPHVNVDNISGCGIVVAGWSFRDVTSEVASQGYAAASAGSASNAATYRDEAGQRASAAETSKTQAETARGQAQTFRDQASLAADNAGGSSQTASQQAGVATQARADAEAFRNDSAALHQDTGALRDSAINFANAASGSAQTATTQADNARQQAEAASAARDVATTAKGQAESARDSAAQSKQDAQSAQSAASQSATTAASASTVAVNSAADTLPSSFANPTDALHHPYFETYEGAQGNLAGVNYVNGYLNITQGVDYKIVRHKGGLRVAPGTRIRATLDVGRGGGPANANRGAYLRFVYNDPNKSGDQRTIFESTGTLNLEADTNRHIMTIESTAPTTLPIFCEAVIFNNYGNVDIFGFTLRDVNSEYQSGLSAAASNQRASDAAASADLSGQRASAADTAKTQAETARGQAQGYASQAAQSRDDASGSAQTATQQAGVATTARDSAQTVAQNLHPTTFENGALYFSGDAQAPEPIGLDYNPNFYGLPAWQTRGSSYGIVSWKSCVPTKPGIWRVRALVGNVNGIASGVQLRIGAYTMQVPLANVRTGILMFSDQPVPSTGMAWVSGEVDLRNVDVGQYPYIRPEAVVNYGGYGGQGTIVRIAAIELIDVTGEWKAAQEASAAAGSASTASTKRDEAGQYADAANASRSQAETARGQAQTFRDEASSARDTANGASSSAQTSSNVAASARDTAIDTAGSLGPKMFKDQRYFSIADKHPNSSSYWEQHAGNEIWWTGSVPDNTYAVLSLNYGMTVVAGRKYQVVTEVSNWNPGTTTDAAPGFIIKYKDGRTSSIDYRQTITSRGNVEQPVTIVSDVLTAGDDWSFVQPRVVIWRGTFFVRSLAFIDVTEREAASASASAANQSYQTAAAKADEASQSASAANGYKGEAQTARGDAQAYAGQALQSKNDAAGSAQTASTASGVATSARDRTIELTASNLFPGFDTQFDFWGWDTNLGRNGPGNWERGHAKGDGFAVSGIDWLYMDPKGWVAKAVGKTYRATYWFYIWNSVGFNEGRMPNPRVYWEDYDVNKQNGRYRGWTSVPPGLKNYEDIPSGGVWYAIGSDYTITDADQQWLRPRVNVDDMTNFGIIVAGWSFRDVTSEVASQGYANASQQSASTASTKADQAGTSAQTATDARNTAQTYRDNAYTYSQNAAGSQAAASQSETNARTYASLSSRFGADALSPNPYFADPSWTGGAPPGFVVWNNGGGQAFIGKSDRQSLYGGTPLQIDRNGSTAETGVVHNFGRMGAGWYVLEADVTAEDGEWGGVGMHINFLNGSAYTIDFGTTADVNERTWAGFASGYPGENRKWAVLIKNNAPCDSGSMYMMASWPGFSTWLGNGRGFVRTIWHKFLIRAATTSEILAQKAAADSATNKASIDTINQTLSNTNGSLATLTTTVAARATGAGNLVSNSTMETKDGWALTSNPGNNIEWAINNPSDDWHPQYENAFSFHVAGSQNGFVEVLSKNFAVEPDSWLQFRMQVASHRCNCWVSVFFWKNDGSWAGYWGENYNTILNSGGRNLNGYEYVGLKAAKVPGDAAFASLVFRKYDTQAGQGDSWAWFTRPYVGYAREGQTTWNPFSHGSNAANNIALSARVTTNEGALATVQGRVEAYFTKEVVAGGATAFISARAKDNNGNYTSDVAIGASTISLYNQTQGGYKLALQLSGGNAVFTGSLNVGATIRLGTGAGWPVALQQRDFAVADDQYLNFGTDLGNVPDFSFIRNNLSPLNSGETYNIYLENPTSQGATLRAKIIVPGTPANYDLTNYSNPGSGPTSQIEKGGNPDSTDGTYYISLYCAGTAYYSYSDGDLR